MIPQIIIIYSLFAKSVWFYYYYGLYFVKGQKYEEEYTGKTALIIPVYNEDSINLKNTIYSVKSFVPKDVEVFFINDGSTDKRVLNILNFNNDGTYKVINLENNVGKRRAQIKAIEQINNNVEVFVFADSDTLFTINSYKELIKPFCDEKVGSVTATILVKNKNDNILTKCLSAMYWSASKIWRKAPNNFGYVSVNNGQLSAYKSNFIRNIADNYINQEFLGVNCTMSDDRYLTHHCQTRYGLKSVYQENCEVYTYVPNTFKATYKMFLRWNKGKWRESLLLTKEAKKKPLLWLDVWGNHLVQIGQTFIRLLIIYYTLFVNWNTILYYLGAVGIISLLYAFDMIINNPKEVFYKILYSYMNEFYFSWSYVEALFKIKQQGIQSWGTR